MERYDLAFQDSAYGKPASVPVIDGWSWELSGDGKGFLLGPLGFHHCIFDLTAASLTFEPDGESIIAPGLSLPLVLEMGETYAMELAFSEQERSMYRIQEPIWEAERRKYNRTVYEKLTGIVQLEHKDGGWLAHVEEDRVKEILPTYDGGHVLSKDDGIQLFRRLCDILHGTPLSDPKGYMALQGNIYEFLQSEHVNQYEDMLQAIDNQIVDGTGYGISAVLDKGRADVRMIMKPVMPKGENFGDLRFLEATEERKRAVRDFIKCRVSKTLIYEKRRGYETATIERANRKFEEAGQRLSEALFGTKSAEVSVTK